MVARIAGADGGPFGGHRADPVAGAIYPLAFVHLGHAVGVALVVIAVIAQADWIVALHRAAAVFRAGHSLARVLFAVLDARQPIRVEVLIADTDRRAVTGNPSLSMARTVHFLARQLRRIALSGAAGQPERTCEQDTEENPLLRSTHGGSSHTTNSIAHAANIGKLKNDCLTGRE